VPGLYYTQQRRVHDANIQQPTNLRKEDPISLIDGL
jgi:hypothetical protein